jgi:hypothetical protein
MSASPVKVGSQLSERPSLSIMDRKKAALFGLYVADAVAMPVHWMYDRRQLYDDYGTISGYVRPKDQFVGSIMNLSNTGGGNPDRLCCHSLLLNFVIRLYIENKS